MIEKYHAIPGKKCVIEFVIPDACYYAALFAVFELGMIVIAEWPNAFNKTDVADHRMTMHGRIDYAIIHHGQLQPNHKYYNYWNLRRTTANVDHVITDLDFDNHKPLSLSYPIWASEQLDAIWAASGGTTGKAKQIKNSHLKCMVQSRRLINHLGFTKDDHVLHIQNLLYGGGIYCYFLPSIMAAQNHTIFVTDSPEKIVQTVIDQKITKIQLHTQHLTMQFLKSILPLNHTLDVLSLYNVSDEYIQLCKDKNIKSLKIMFGDSTIGVGFFIKTIDKTYVPMPYGYVGRAVDDFFCFDIKDGVLWVSVPILNQPWQTSEDRFECTDGDYFFHGRANKYSIKNQTVILGDLDLVVEKLFSGRATIVIDQEYEKIYLAIWKDNSLVEEQKLKEYLSTNYQGITIDQTAKNINPDRFTVSRKIDREKLKDYFRYYHQKPVVI